MHGVFEGLNSCTSTVATVEDWYASTFAGKQDSSAQLQNTNPEASAVPRQAWLHGKSASNGRRKPLLSFILEQYIYYIRSGQLLEITVGIPKIEKKGHYKNRNRQTTDRQTKPGS